MDLEPSSSLPSRVTMTLEGKGEAGFVKLPSIYDDLFSKKLLIVTGKGGVGKSTLIAHLAKRAVFACDKEVTIFSVGQSGFYEDRLTSKRRAKDLLAGKEVPLFPGATVQVLLTYPTFLEYLNIRFKVPRTFLPVLNLAFLRNLFLAIPGLAATVLLGKIVFEAKKRVASNENALVLVEAPPIGQVESFFGVYDVLQTLFRFGLVHKEAVSVLSALRDPEFSELVLVTLLDDLPIEETLTYWSQKHDPKLCLRYLVCNRVLFVEELSGRRAASSLVKHNVGGVLLQRERRFFRQLADMDVKKVAFGDQMDVTEGNLVSL